MEKQDKKTKFLNITLPASEMYTRNELKPWQKVFGNKLKINYLEKKFKRLFFFKINVEYNLLLENIQNKSTKREVAVVQKSSEVYFETQVMSVAGQPATSLLFWHITMENQTGPIQQIVTFVKLFIKGKEKKI